MSRLQDCCQWTCEVFHNEDGGLNDSYLATVIPETEKLRTKTLADAVAAGAIPGEAHQKKQLFNRHGYNLAIFSGGHVKGKNKIVVR